MGSPGMGKDLASEDPKCPPLPRLQVSIEECCWFSQCWGKKGFWFQEEIVCNGIEVGWLFDSIASFRFQTIGPVRRNMPAVCVLSSRGLGVWGLERSRRWQSRLSQVFGLFSERASLLERTVSAPVPCSQRLLRRSGAFVSSPRAAREKRWLVSACSPSGKLYFLCPCDFVSSAFVLKDVISQTRE